MAQYVAGVFSKMLKKMLSPVTWFALGVSTAYVTSREELFTDFFQRNENALIIIAGAAWRLVFIAISVFLRE